jgi:parallel beta-helix repeat protein
MRRRPPPARVSLRVLARVFTLIIALLAAPAPAQDPPVPPAAAAPLVLTVSTTFPHGARLATPLVIAADGIVIDGNGAVLVGPATPGQPTTGTGIGIRAAGRSGIVLRNLTVRGFRTGLQLDGGRDWVIEGCDLSDNWHDPEADWGDGERQGGMVITGAAGCRITRCRARRNWNGLDLQDCRGFVVERCDFSHCSNTCLKLWRARDSSFAHNDLSYGLRIRDGEVHARDSTGVLLESGSDHNRFVGNDVTHGGDGIFLRALNGWISTGNHFAGNDCSYANNNGIESWCPGNTFVGNKANHCSYGFWLGGSDRSIVVGNEASWNGLETGFHNAAEGDFGHGGIVIVGGSGTHSLIDGNRCVGNNGAGIALRGDLESRGARWQTLHVVVQRNVLEQNRVGIFARFAANLWLSANEFAGNGTDELLEAVAPLHRLPARAPGVERPQGRLVGPDRAVVGEPAAFDASSFVAGDPAVTCEWDADGSPSTGPRLLHRFTKPGFHRVSLTAHQGGLATPAGLDVYVVAPDEDPSTEADLARWRAAEGHRAMTVRAATAAGDLAAQHPLVGTQMLELDTAGYRGGDVALFLDGAFDLSATARIEFWLQWQNPNQGGFQGPHPVLCLDTDPTQAPGTMTLEYTPVRARLPRNLLAELPYAEAREGWLQVTIPLAGSDDWLCRVRHRGVRPPFVAGRLRIATLTTNVGCDQRASLLAAGDGLFLASEPGGVFRSTDGANWSPLPHPEPALGHRPEWQNGMLAFVPQLGDRGSLLLTAPSHLEGDLGAGNRQLIVFDLATAQWRYHPTITAMTHGALLVGDRLLGFARSVGGNFGGPLCRIDLGKAPRFDEHSLPSGIAGAAPEWISPAAQLALLGNLVYGIKNDWTLRAELGDGEPGDRLYAFDPAAFAPSEFRGGRRWDDTQWRAASTPCRDLGALPFEIGHGACLVALPPGFGGLVGDAGGLFLLAGCSPANHEGDGAPSDLGALYDVALGTWQPFALPAPTGAGTSACRFGDRILIKRGGLHDDESDHEAWLVDVVDETTAAELARQQAARPEAPDLRAIRRLTLHFDSAGGEPFTIRLDGLRFVPR